MGMKAHRGIRLFLADVDGALLTGDKVLTDAAQAAVRALRAAGIAFAITSGRPPRGMAMLIEPLALTGPIAGFNGAVFVNPDLSVVARATLVPAAAERALALILDRGLDAGGYGEAGLCFTRRTFRRTSSWSRSIRKSVWGAAAAATPNDSSAATNLVPESSPPRRSP
jgi:hydroxymethylpyrimidine pyrophosphatase-like HAD family hydrolase